MRAALGDVRRRQPRDHLGAAIGKVDHPVDACGEAHQVAVAELHALGRSRGAGRVDQGQQVVGADGRDRVGDVEVGSIASSEASVWSPPSPSTTISVSISGSSARFLEGREERRLDHRHLRSRVRAHVLDLLGRRGLVDRERDRAERDRAHVDRDELGTVVEHQGDRVALADAEAREPAGDPPDLVAELVPADPHGVVTLARDDRRIVAQPLDGLVEGDGQVLRTARHRVRRSHGARPPWPPSLSLL